MTKTSQSVLPTITSPRTRVHRPVLITLARCALVLVFGLPIVFMIISSLKPDLQIFADLGSWRAFAPVGEISLDNYSGVFARVPFWQFFANSVFIAGTTVALMVSAWAVVGTPQPLVLADTLKTPLNGGVPAGCRVSRTRHGTRLYSDNPPVVIGAK